MQQPGSRHEDDLTRGAEESGRTVGGTETRWDCARKRERERERRDADAGASCRMRAHAGRA